MKFAEKLKQARIQAGLTQTELAEKLGVTGRTLQNYESGNIYPKKREMYERLAILFQTDMDYWLAEGDSEVSANARELVMKASKLFSDAGLSDAEMDKVMKSIQDAYWTAKETNIKTIKK